MFINKLTQSVRIPYNIVKGSFKQRQHKSNMLVEKLFENINSSIKDDYSIFTYKQLQKHIDSILPDGNFKIIIQNMSEKNAQDSEGICETLFNKDKDIRALSIGLGGIGNTIRSKHIPIFMHEFQHVTDDMFHPKYLSRLQSLNKKGLANEKYENFYENYYYCTEYIESKQDKKNILKLIKNKTRKFLRAKNISDKMDFIQDMRYSLKSEIESYKKQLNIAQRLKAKGILINDFDFKDMSKECLFEEKINLLKNLALEYIKKERLKNSAHLNKLNKNK